MKPCHNRVRTILGDVLSAIKKQRTRQEGANTNGTVWLGRHITVNPQIRGGEPCFENTRVPVATVLEYLAHVGSIDKVCAAWPCIVTSAGLEEALQLSAQALALNGREQAKRNAR